MIQDKHLLPASSSALGRQGPTSPSDLRHFNQMQLARRWNLSDRTLERWRWLKQGPAYIKLGGHVVYRLEDIEAYEQLQIRAAGAQRASKG